MLRTGGTRATAHVGLCREEQCCRDWRFAAIIVRQIIPWRCARRGVGRCCPLRCCQPPRANGINDQVVPSGRQCRGRFGSPRSVPLISSAISQSRGRPGGVMRSRRQDGRRFDSDTRRPLCIETSRWENTVNTARY